MTQHDVLEHLLRVDSSGSQRSFATLASWFDRLAECPFATKQIDRALWAGSEADRLGYAFVGGYRAALAQLFDPVVLSPLPKRLSLAATEKGGGHPKAIETTLAPADDTTNDAFRLDGEKTFATLASVADEILVVAWRDADADADEALRRGEALTMRRLALVRVRRDAPGMSIVDRDPTPFAPEIPHARVTFTNVRIAPHDVLPGDGYSAYLKPFRTIEDTHVIAAALGYVMKTARTCGFASAVSEGALALVVALREVATMPPLDAKAHLILAGIFEGARRLINAYSGEWDKAGRETRDRWQRDIGLLMVAEMVRTKRTEAAWKVIAA